MSDQCGRPFYCNLLGCLFVLFEQFQCTYGMKSQIGNMGSSGHRLSCNTPVFCILNKKLIFLFSISTAFYYQMKITGKYKMNVTDNQSGLCLALYCYRFISWSNHSHPFLVRRVSHHSVQSYAGLAELVGAAGGEAGHIAISDGRVLGLSWYSTFPGSESEKKTDILLLS